jgi:hypothetical protein
MGVFNFFTDFIFYLPLVGTMADEHLLIPSIHVSDFWTNIGVF